MITKHKVELATAAIVLFCMAVGVWGVKLHQERQEVLKTLNDTIFNQQEEIASQNETITKLGQDTEFWRNQSKEWEDAYTNLVFHPVIKEVTVEKIVYQKVPIEIQEWQNLEEFLRFCPVYTPIEPNSCLWAVEYIQRMLMSQGYPISIAISRYGRYDGIEVNGIYDAHAGLMVGIQGVYYFYDPETKKITKLF